MKRQERFQARRRDRWARRRQLRPISSLRRVQQCGHKIGGPDSGPTLGVITNKDGTRSAAYGGLKHCGSVWACPVCAVKVATRRADDLTAVMRAVHERCGSAFMLTLTMRHARGDRLGLSTADRRRRDLLEERRADREVAEANGWDVDERAAEAEEIELAGIKAKEGCWDVLGYAWAAVTSGSTWVKDSALFGGLLGWARVVEVTDGANGWHVHVHALLCFADDVSAELVAAGVGARMFGRWRRALERKGFDASDEHGWDLRKAHLGEGDLADYFTKMAHEVTGATSKHGRSHGGRTPMQLLAEAVDTYRADDLARWWEWEEASDGRRQLTWSRGGRDLRHLAGLGRESTDDEIADEDQEADARLTLSADAWDWLVTSHREAELLDTAERRGLADAEAWLRSNGLVIGISLPRPARAQRQETSANPRRARST
ncbi:hypothetical protein [Actinomycetospora lemnae]|uniref:Replication protein n=1 Tax=Actinomycetospora lemnae TaxID=3019891 RepID=A0ABT5SV52_9PSEU|nr:hypothetical protein [Actinomycetospora sp. DW7H6]MDD7965897.1 hypothetical protein [Actinomycetospora sp. DW7H6]